MTAGGSQDLGRPLQYLKGVGPRRAQALEKLGLRTLGDLLYHFPDRYYDRRQMTPLAKLRPGEPATVQGVVTNIRSTRSERQKILILEVTVEDGEGRDTLVWFR